MNHSIEKNIDTPAPINPLFGALPFSQFPFFYRSLSPLIDQHFGLRLAQEDFFCTQTPPTPSNPDPILAPCQERDLCELYFLWHAQLTLCTGSTLCLSQCFCIRTDALTYFFVRQSPQYSNPVILQIAPEYIQHCQLQHNF